MSSIPYMSGEEVAIGEKYFRHLFPNTDPVLNIIEDIYGQPHINNVDTRVYYYLQGSKKHR